MAQGPLNSKTSNGSAVGIAQPSYAEMKAASLGDA